MRCEPYWFICVEESERREDRTRTRYAIIDDPREERLLGALLATASVQEEFNAFPKPVARVLDPFILYDWDSFEHNPSWQFNIPFIFEISNDLCEEPRKIPKIMSMCGGDGEYDIDWDVELSSRQSDSFRHSISRTRSILTELMPHVEGNWRFLDVALLFFRYAFVSKAVNNFSPM